MRKSRFTPEQILQALRQAESGTPVVEICRKLGVTETTSSETVRSRRIPAGKVSPFLADREDSGYERRGVASADDDSRGKLGKRLNGSRRRAARPSSRVRYLLLTKQL